MDFTREPIVETVITSRDGYKIVVRSSKNHGQEEFVVDAVEVISFGSACFFRSLERPKVFIVPALDYEILETREQRVPLKAAPLEGVIRTPTKSVSREPERRESIPQVKEPIVEPESIGSDQPVEGVESTQPSPEVRPDRRRDRKKNLRRRRSGKDEPSEESSSESIKTPEGREERNPPVVDSEHIQQTAFQKEPVASPIITSILPPPSTLIRDDLKRLRGDEQYKGAFFMTEEETVSGDEGDDDAPVVPLSLRGDDELPRRGDEEVAEAAPQEENTYKATPAPLEDEPFWGVRSVKTSPSEQPPSAESTKSPT